MNRLLREILSSMVRIHMIEWCRSTFSGKRKSGHFGRMKSIARGRCSWGCSGCRVHIGASVSALVAADQLEEAGQERSAM